MSTLDKTVNILRTLPENQIKAVYNLLVVMSDNLSPETLAAMDEVEDMIQNDSGQHFDGSTADFTNMLSTNSM